MTKLIDDCIEDWCKEWTDDEPLTRHRGTRCECRGPEYPQGHCPGPKHCPMAARDDEDALGEFETDVDAEGD